MFPDPSPKLGDSDNNLLFKIAQLLAPGLSGSSPISQTLADARYVNVTGDTLTGALALNSGPLSTSDPSISITQTWTDAGVTYTGLRADITNTASAGASMLLNFLVGGVSRFQVRRTGTVINHRQEADVAAATYQASKRGKVGDSTGAISAGSAIGSYDFLAWDGATQAEVGTIRAFSIEPGDFSSTAHGTQLVFGVPAVGATTVSARLSISATAINAQAGAAYQLNGVALHNPLSVYAAGTVYTLTATSAAVDFGTTDPIITVNAAGTYKIVARVKVNLNAATFAATRTFTVKLRRTNNTAADVANSSTTYTVQITSALTQTLAVIELPAVLYTTALTTDTLQLFADISVVPTAGTISIDEASIVAVRLS